MPRQRRGSLLHSTVENIFPVPSYSKAPRGLFVLVQVGRIFTAISISPGEGSRQSLARSAFRAGRNLPDKGLRYHRTVIVTAAVHSGFDPQPSPCGVTRGFNLRALGRRQPLYFAFRLCRDLCFS
ncbi:MAG: Cell wall-associated hydrolase [Microgenomates group bacterium LiPW_16]|nr:MAG: Cell wall-associated hydrolase [Microgenomates group bacterium LiPW_16]